jgi:hypothetical protein
MEADIHLRLLHRSIVLDGLYKVWAIGMLSQESMVAP